MPSHRLTDAQLHALACHRENVTRAVELLRSVAPEHWMTAWRAAKLCERVITPQGRYIATEEAVRVLAGFVRACRALGPGSQDALRSELEPLIERMGLTEAVHNAAADSIPTRAFAI